jgi:hypothetical protein
MVDLVYSQFVLELGWIPDQPRLCREWGLQSKKITVRIF